MSSASHQRIVYAQNFLKDSRLVASLLARCDINSTDVVYEIGPGKGIITEQLARCARQVVAIEIDPYLSNLLRQHFADRHNVMIHEGDFLQYHLPHKPYKVFANIPFNITTATVTKLTTAEYPPEDAYLVVQKEAAERFLGWPHESLYSVLLKPWFEVEILHRFRRKDFVPPPRVDVVMLRLRKRGPPLIHRADRQVFRDFVVHTFTAWQPSLAHILKDIFTRQQLKHIGKELELNLDRTPTSLTFEQWLSLFERFKKIGSREAICIIMGSEARLQRQQERLQKRHKTSISDEYR